MRKTLSKKEKKQLQLPIEIGKKDVVEIEEGEEKILYINQKPHFFWKDEWVPLLWLVLEGKINLPKVTVDSGALPYLLKGANVMRPGIKKMENFQRSQIVAVVEERHGKAIAVGRALYSSEEIEKMERGKVIENLHHVGGRLWKLLHPRSSSNR